MEGTCVYKNTYTEEKIKVYETLAKIQCQKGIEYVVENYWAQKNWWGHIKEQRVKQMVTKLILEFLFIFI